MLPITGGVWPAMLTPLTDSREPNQPVLDRIVELFIQQGLDGLYILGSTGHGPAMTLEQRKTVAARVLKFAAGRIPVMVHVGCIATEDAMELARHAADHGADAISSVPPIYFPATADATFEHYRRIASATTLPFFPYHAMFIQQAALSGAEYGRRLLQIPNIGGMKLTDRDLYLFGLIRHYTQGKLVLFSGADELICHAAISGAAGAIGTFYNQWGREAKAVRAAFVGGDLARGQRFMAAFQVAIDRILASGSIHQFIRQSMQVMYGLDIGPGRTPVSAVGKPWRDEDVRAVVESVQQAAR